MTVILHTYDVITHKDDPLLILNGLDMTFFNLHKLHTVCQEQKQDPRFNMPLKQRTSGVKFLAQEHEEAAKLKWFLWELNSKPCVPQSSAMTLNLCIMICYQETITGISTDVARGGLLANKLILQAIWFANFAEDTNPQH